jgi:hypothetical protein
MYPRSPVNGAVLYDLTVFIFASTGGKSDIFFPFFLLRMVLQVLRCGSHSSSSP